MSKARLEAFSDGVFAIVITLLVLDLHGPTEGQSIAQAVVDERYAIGAYVVAFLVVGVLWINHHGVFRHAARVDRTTTMVNLLLLLLITATPFTASLFADGLDRGGADARSGAVIFSAVFAGVALTYAGLWTCIARPGILQEHLDVAGARRALRGFGLGAVPYLLLVVVALVWPLGVLVGQALLGLYYAVDQLDPAEFTRVDDAADDGS